MSDSESDFAYESAGEDAELGDSAVNDWKSVLPGNKTASIAGENVESTETKETEPTVTNTDCMKDQLTEVTEEVEYLTSNNKCAGDVQGNVHWLESTNQLSSFGETASKDMSLFNRGTKQNRVKLRLQEKLTEKSQPASSKISPDVSVAESASVPEKKNSSWGWGSWGTSLLSSAATSVTTFTSQVSQGIGTVLETVETTLAATPHEEELAVSLAHKETSDPVDESEETGAEATTEETEGSVTPTASLFSGVSSLTKVIESTGAKVIMGGLDTLELIGKKTIDILTEGDPGLRRKRAALSESMTLSQILRDAQNKTEEMKFSESDEIPDALLYAKCFEEFQGLVHLEALEMLSNQCQSKVQNMLVTVSCDSAMKHILDEIKDICEDLSSSSDDTDDEADQDFVALLSQHMKALHLPMHSRNLEQVQIIASKMIRAYDQQQDENAVEEVYYQAVSCLAEFTAKCVEHFHKIGELILVQPNIQTYVIDCTTHLAELTSVMTIETGNLSDKFCDCLNAIADINEEYEAVSPLITSVYLEASNSTAYIQDAFQLLIPVIQLATLQ